MDITKRTLARELLTCRLEMEALRNGFAPVERAAYVAGLLEDYLSRLVGALGLPGWTMHDLEGSDTVGIVDIGVEVLHSEIQNVDLPSSDASRWQSVRNGWASFAATGDRDKAEHLREQVALIEAALRALA